MILIQNRTIEEDYAKNNTVSLLQENAESIIRKVDTSTFAEKDFFFIYKDPVAKTFQAFTGAANEQYKYIDKDGNSITNTGTFVGDLYSRIFTIERWDTGMGKSRQVIKGGIRELIRK